LEVSRLLPDDIATVASALLYKAGRDRCSLMSDVLHVRLSQGEPVALRLSAHPVDDPSEERLTLLCFETPVEGGGPSAHLPLDVDAETADRLHLLERELAATRENLQATIEELETANEELQATNEELMASNEELQSSNEELQSVNEEMSTVNAEFQEKMLTLARINADLDSMAKAAGVATVFVDGEFHITRFSPDATQVFKLRESDLGRPLDDITHMLDYPRLMEDLGDTLRHQHTLEREVFSLDGKRMFLVRLLPYLVPSTTDRGAVATFVDVTAVHNAKRLQAIIDALPEHIAVVDPVGVIVMVNAAWRRFARVNGDPDLVNCGVGINYLRVCEAALAGDGPLAQAALNGLRDVLDGSLPGYSLEYACHSEHERRWFVMHVAPMVGSDYGAVVSHVNISAWHQREVS
jgi:two-component system CheB/CheR fusion protein